MQLTSSLKNALNIVEKKIPKNNNKYDIKRE